MLFSQNASKTICLFLLYYSLARLHDHVVASHHSLCSNNSHYADQSPFQNSLEHLLSSLKSISSTSKFGNVSSGTGANRVYGLFMCFGNSTDGSCSICVTMASEGIEKNCPKSKEAAIWEEHCQLRYSNNNFFGTLDVTGNRVFRNKMNISEPEQRQFRSTVHKILEQVSDEAAYDPWANKCAKTRKRWKKMDWLTAEVQCTRDLSPDDCKLCLQTAMANVSSYRDSSRGARVYSKNCYLRYELYAFDGNPAEQEPRKNSKWNRDSIILLLSAFLAIALLGSFIYCLKMKSESPKGQSDEITGQDIRSQEVPLYREPSSTDFLNQMFNVGDEQKSKEFPYIDIASILEATENFSESNMLGQGGFGPVYKGKIRDGREIAVKRLASCSHQGSEEFTNEVLLIMKLQHKNLVRLLGFCANGEEKLLVYEFMPNGSLDVFLFDPNKSAQLSWSRRLGIINGIARGLLYLHEDSRLRIIHRDLKASNILLDSNMDPKISDFGTARIVAGNEDEASTCRLVGTYGYMAPEYAMEGVYSIKSDVFSFGVLLLEIITGKRNAGFYDQSILARSLLSYAWQLWNEGKAMELMDPSLAESCCGDEFLKCVYIALMCVQEDACERPAMSAVMLMLKSGSESSNLRQPDRPAFSWGISYDYDEINVDGLSFDTFTEKANL